MKRLLSWNGTTSPRDINVPDVKKDPFETFRWIEATHTASISVVYDEQRGSVWLADKPSDDENYRCETNGIKINEPPYSSYESWDEGQLYDISWSSKLPESNNVAKFGDYVLFQWKSASPHTQNYPFLVRVSGSKVYLTHSNYQGDWITIWSGDFNFDQWFDIHIRVLLSRDKNTGKIMLTYNGVSQTFSKDQYNQDSHGLTQFTGRTLDDSTNYLKWGIYNRDMPGHALKHYFDRLFVKQIR